MHQDPIIFSVFLIFSGAAVLATLALYTRQSLLVSYILLGALIGPSGFKLVTDASTIKQFSNFGIIFLLFLMGLNLQPQNLFNMLKSALFVTIASSLVFFGVGFAIASYLGFSHIEAMVIGAAMIFSSTIIGLKLLPTTVLHHQHAGEVVISILLLQDLIAIVIMLLLNGYSSSGLSMTEILWIAVALPGLLGFAFLGERFILRMLLNKFDRIQEYVFLLAIGWCLGFAELAEVAGLSVNIGAFIAGVSIAASPISFYIADSLRPLRDFFLILFFFSLGAALDIHFLPEVMLPASFIAVTMLLIKPFAFSQMLSFTKESKRFAQEVGIRLGQLSEFSLLVGYLAFETAVIGSRAMYTIQAATVLTFIVSSYFVILRYPTPIAVTDALRRD